VGLVDGPQSAPVPQRHARQSAGDGQLLCTARHRWQPGHLIHRHFEPRRNSGDRSCETDQRRRPDQWGELHVHRHRHHCQRKQPAIDRVETSATERDLRPANDTIGNAQVISGDSGTVTGTNVNATLEPGEPRIFGNAGGASIGYVWTPTTGGGLARFDACGSSFTTITGVYRISNLANPVAVGNLSSIVLGAGNIHCPDGITSAPYVEFDVNQAGGTLYIRRMATIQVPEPPSGNLNPTWAKR